jgi:hypothetical protein
VKFWANEVVQPKPIPRQVANAGEDRSGILPYRRRHPPLFKHAADPS